MAFGVERLAAERAGRPARGQDSARPTHEAGGLRRREPHPHHIRTFGRAASRMASRSLARIAARRAGDAGMGPPGPPRSVAISAAAASERAAK